MLCGFIFHSFVKILNLICYQRILQTILYIYQAQIMHAWSAQLFMSVKHFDYHLENILVVILVENVPKELISFAPACRQNE